MYFVNLLGLCDARTFNYSKLIKLFYDSKTAKRCKSAVESRTQGSRPRTDLPRTDPFKAKDRNARDQGHNMQVFSKKKVFSEINRKFSENSGDLKK